MPDPIDAAGTGTRLRRLFAPSRRQLLVALVVCIVTAATVITARERRADTSYDTLRRADLVTLLDSLTAQSNRLTAERDRLAQTRTELENGATAREAAEQATQNRLNVLEVLSGRVAATGPGISVVINDPQAKLTPDVLIDCVQELRDAGAEAIQIDGTVRVVASTWFDQEDGRLVASGATLTRPLHIEAIGDAQTLASALQFRGGLVSTVEASPIAGHVRIDEQTRVDITSLAPAPVWKYASPS